MVSKFLKRISHRWHLPDLLTSSTPQIKRITMAGSFKMTVFILLLSLTVCSTAALGFFDVREKPNIIMILVDDLGYADIGCNGSSFYQTPNIDRLADQGMRFTDAYAACPVCSPTRLSIVAGKYPARVGLTDWIAGDRWPDNSPLQHREWQKYMPPEEITIAEALRQNGYLTAMIGKWHLNAKNNFANTLQEQTSPEAQGFQVLDSNPPNRSDKRVSAMTDRAIEFITDNAERPFFLYFSHYSVHIPLEASPELIEKHTRRIEPTYAQQNPTYAAMVETVDTSVGRVVAAVEELGLAENTMIIFFSDNGGLDVYEGPKTPATNNAPLRGGKGFIYEGGIRVPLIVRWPGVVSDAALCSTPVSSVDFYPTFLEISGTVAPEKQILDGESLMPLLKQNGTPKRDAIYWHYPHYSNQGGLPAAAIRKGNYKLIEKFQDGKIELYDVVKDLGEQHDLSTTMPTEAKAMKMQLRGWLDSLGASIPSANPNHDSTLPIYTNPQKAPRAWQKRDAVQQ